MISWKIPENKDFFQYTILLSVIFGALMGIIIPLFTIIRNKYAGYGFYWTIAVLFRRSLNTWIMVIMTCGLIFYLIVKVSGLRPFRFSNVRTIKKISFLMIGSTLVLNLGIGIEKKGNPPNKPNIIILLVDTLRKDHMSLYGYHRNTTPNIDQFSREAIVFQNAITQCPWTSPSVASLFTGLYVSTHGCTSYSSAGKEVEADFLNHKLLTIAELMQEQDYKTGAFVANPWICKRLGFDQGFDVFDPISPEFKPRAPEVNEKAIDWIKLKKNKPFFLYMHYMDVHGPYNPPPNYDIFFRSNEKRELTQEEASKLKYLSHGRERDNNNLNYYIDQYDGEIRFLDDQIGTFLNKLKELSLFESSIIIITSDHGEAFFEHGFCDHGWSLYNEEIDIPLIVKIPDSDTELTNKNQLVAIIDLYSTILSFQKGRFPYKLEGSDLFDKTGKTEWENRILFSEELSKKVVGPPQIAMIEREYKFILPLADQSLKELYLLKNDLYEMNNLASSRQDFCTELQSNIELWQSERSQKKLKLKLTETSAKVSSKKRMDRLKSLGYVK